jgi:DNA-binding XRE family transcriptional regulator
MKTILFSNLAAEQAKRGMTDADVAKLVGITAQTYSVKKKRGTFKANECAALCVLFGKTFEFLFDTRKEA